MDGSKSQSDSLNKYLKNNTLDIKKESIIISDDSLDKGELSAMILYKQLNADFLLIDDRKGRRIPELNQISIIGSVGVLLLAKKKNLIPEIKSRIDIIIDSGIFLSEEIIIKVLQASNEI
ncbi:MAG TPA: DUF3368 domain-containing protein [Leptospiraceae bacterium]|nr:DUF3368 domain-containing protein [Leptospiraceae bacterium]HMW07308.1 DUF3368 domain-containing protein [Leptospiraceae bacterium]HMX34042.1 DUF3368 domain-containing protein [Leptospiraceae bacterium]HMY32984.1 DUF3368 domain-containing protein [Leptospiraceae bacterium]HMZ67476.1 DUF3368 domain-containing protein [Leptospiraceae bacterium]